MSLYVNAAVHRTRGSYVYLGQRGVFSRRSLSLVSSNAVKLRSQQRIPSSRICQHLAQSHTTPCPRRVSSPVHSVRPEVDLCISLRQDDRAHSTTSVETTTTLHKHKPRRDPAAEDALIYSDSLLSGTSTTESRRALRSVSSADRITPSKTPLYTLRSEPNTTEARSRLSPRSLRPSNGNLNRKYAQSSVHHAEESINSSPNLRRIPIEFRDHLEQLRELMNEQRGNEYIRTTFSDVISAKENLFKEHGSTIGKWLIRPWNDIEAIQVTRLVFGCILTSPSQAITILRYLPKVQNDFHFRARCLSFIGQLHKSSLVGNYTLMAMFDEEVSKLRNPHLWPTHGISRRDLSLMLWQTNIVEAEKLVQSYLDVNPKPELDVHLWLAMYCARHKMDLMALSLLTSLPPELLQSPSQLVLQCCHVLLGHDVVESTPEGPNFKLLPRLLEHGLTPDSMLYSRIIERAFESGYPRVAWDVFRHLQTNKVSITGRTYFLLLQHAFSENNVTGVQEIMSEIEREDALRKNLPLLHYSMNIVRRIFYHESQMTTPESLSHILALYDRVFLRAPLRKLGILPPLGAEAAQAGSARTDTKKQFTEPDAHSLAFTVWAYVLCHRSGKHAQTLWKRIQELIETGDPIIIECMKHDLVYNAFIWLNLREARTLAGALEILQYMLAKQLCMPTDRTWSILICGFLRHNQKAQAQHLYDLMKQCDLGLRNIRREYWRKQWTMEYFEKHLEEILDEGMMPDGTETGGLIAASKLISRRMPALSDIELEEVDDYA